MKKSVVSIVKGTDPEKMVEEALSLLGGVDSLIKPNSTVVVKPNAGHVFPPETSVNTSPAVIAAVIKVLRKARPKEIILAESSAIGQDTMECLEVSGIGKAAEEAGVNRIIDIKQEKDLISIPIRGARSALTRTALPRFLLEADFIVDVPIFKSHVSVVFTCALKNMKGVVQDKVHYQMHQTNLAEALVDLWTVIRPDLSIVDLIRPAEGFGPHATIPADVGCIVAGKDTVAVDATVCRLVGLDIKKVDYYEPVRKRRIGNVEENRIEIRGKPIKEAYKKLWLPYLEGLDSWPEYNIYAEGACSSCQGLLAFTMEKLKSLGEYEKNKGASIIIGPKRKLPEGVKPGKDLILVGDCTKKYRGQGVFAEGCPPAEPYPLWAIIDRKDWTGFQPGIRDRMAAEGKIFEDYMAKMRKKMEEKS